MSDALVKTSKSIKPFVWKDITEAEGGWVHPTSRDSLVHCIVRKLATSNVGSDGSYGDQEAVKDARASTAHGTNLSHRNAQGETALQTLLSLPDAYPNMEAYLRKMTPQ